jgi:hypothetical protein
LKPFYFFHLTKIPTFKITCIPLIPQQLSIMTQYTIKVYNKSDANQHFLLFNETPSASSNISQVWSNVWVKSGVVDHPHGTATFEITSTFYGVCGTTPSKLSSGTSVSTSDWADVSITAGNTNGTKLQLNVEDDGPIFDSTAVSTTSTKGSFAINTNSFDSTKHGMLLIIF